MDSTLAKIREIQTSDVPLLKESCRSLMDPEYHLCDVNRLELDVNDILNDLIDSTGKATWFMPDNCSKAEELQRKLRHRVTVLWRAKYLESIPQVSSPLGIL